MTLQEGYEEEEQEEELDTGCGTEQSPIVIDSDTESTEEEEDFHVKVELSDDEVSGPSLVWRLLAGSGG